MPSSELPSSQDQAASPESEFTSHHKTVYISSVPRDSFQPKALHKPKVDSSLHRASSASQKLSTEEFLAVTQCKTKLSNADADQLTHESSLIAWMSAWERAGILGSVMTASLGDIELSKRILSTHGVSLEQVDVRSWPVWGLRVLAEEQRIQLNNRVRHNASQKGHVRRICSSSASHCSRAGIEAPLIDWIRVWHGSRTRNAVLAAVAGVGHCYPSLFISHCEMAAAKGAISFRVSMFAPPHARSVNPTYVLSGYLRQEGNANIYGYHPYTRDQIPSLDAHSWLTGNRFTVTHQIHGSHPFDLIERSSRLGLTALNGCHVMGLHLRKEPYSQQDQLPDVHDVISLGIESPDLSDALTPSRRMPGVYPATWIVDVIGESAKVDNRVCATVLSRFSDRYEMIVNGWLIRIGHSCGLPMHSSSDLFRTAKCADAESGRLTLLCPASDFSARVGKDGALKTYSRFRMPVGSLIGTGILIKGVKQSDSQVFDLESAVENLIGMLRECLGHPHPDLHNLVLWLVFDSLIGTLGQIPYRYQLCLLNPGLSLTPIPFWSTEPSERFSENTKLDFGYQLLMCDTAAREKLSGAALERLAALAGITPGTASCFRESALSALRLSAATISAHLESEAKRYGELDSPSFRSAKSMVDWISSNVLTRPNGVPYER